MAKGRIHSIESMGLVDGPGIRTVVFLQGCHLRCAYCHNPDTWSMEGEGCKEMSPQELLQKLNRFRPYYGTEGGVTFSGGEPLLQPEFLVESLRLCREAGIHTCIDTAGYATQGIEDILSYTDLMLLDVKHYTPEGFRQVTGGDFGRFEAFLRTAQQMKIPLWIRHVVVPGLTDGEEHLAGLGEFLRTISNVQRVELLPYHTLGVHKYAALGIPYPLEGVPPMEKESLTHWQQQFQHIIDNNKEEQA